MNYNTIHLLLDRDEPPYRFFLNLNDFFFTTYLYTILVFYAMSLSRVRRGNKRALRQNDRVLVINVHDTKPFS